MGKKPRCCDRSMLRASARLRLEGDSRPTSKVPYHPVGWYCPKCGDVKSLKVGKDLPLL